MKKYRFSAPASVDHLSFLWLALALVLSLFAVNGRWDIALAAWFFPVFLLRFVRTQSSARGFFGAWLVNIVAFLFWYYQTFTALNPFFIGVGVISAALLTLPYLADRLLASHLNGVVSTLVFPLTSVLINYLKMLISPLGSIGSIAYTQYGNLPLLQLLAVTGVAGIVFLITWFASAANWAWQEDFSWFRIRSGILLYSSLLGLVLLGGGARLAFFPPEASTVQVASINVSPALKASTQQQGGNAANAIAIGKGTLANQETFRKAFAVQNQELFTLSQREASAGGKIILWPEVSAWVLEEDRAAFLVEGATLARKNGIYLEIGLAVFNSQAPFTNDQAVLINPQGHVVWTYDKTYPVPGGIDTSDQSGPGVLPLASTLYGRLSTLICYDGDFPALARQAGQARADILLVPADDFREIDPWHTQNLVFRAIENGYSVVRETDGGRSIATDYLGHVLASSDYFTTNSQVMIADVSIRGTQTIYAVVGDLFTYLCIICLMAMMTLVLLNFRKRHAVTQVEDASRLSPVS